MIPHVNELTYKTIGAAIEVHRTLGPGLLESSYRECLCRELFLRGINFRREHGHCNIKVCALIVVIESIFWSNDLVVVEIKAVDELASIHDAHLLTYLRLGDGMWDC